MWEGSKSPSYADCLRLINSGTAEAISLGSPSNEGLAGGGWACAVSKAGEILRVQYLGMSLGGNNYQFEVTAWHRPASL